MGILLGCIADDFTGATDLAGMLVRAGMRTIQVIGTPDTAPPPDVDAVVIALKSRTSPAPQAINDSLSALRFLREAGCRQIYFKYCSTFDSTDRGNIGPVTDVLMDGLEVSFTVACPAFPDNGRTLYNGHLFVGDTLLGESGMRHHPLTPMTDSNLVRVLQRQTDSRVDLISFSVVTRGTAAIGERIQQLQAQGTRIAVVDAVSNDDLIQIGAACAELPLVTAGSGMALGLPQNFRSQGLLNHHDATGDLPAAGGARAILCGSCSQTSQAQLADLIGRGTPAFSIDPTRLARSDDVAAEALHWAAPLVPTQVVVIYATASAENIKATQQALGREQAGTLIEQTMGKIAIGLVALGVGQLIVAGGETSGAVVSALNVRQLRIGRQIDPGIPWSISEDSTPPLHLALKSGNFGSIDFFTKAWNFLP